MTTRTVSFVLLLLAVASAAVAQNAPPPVCLRSIDIEYTKTPNDHTILFFMKDGKAWSTTLRSACPGLIFNGFEYAPTPRDNICANLQTIRVLKSGAICEIGPLVPEPPDRPAAPVKKPGTSANVVNSGTHADVH